MGLMGLVGLELIMISWWIGEELFYPPIREW